jgi:hypothetical protein
MSNIVNIDDLFLVAYKKTSEFPDWARTWGTVRLFEYIAKDAKYFEQVKSNRSLDDVNEPFNRNQRSSDNKLPEVLLKQYNKIKEKKEVHIKVAREKKEEIVQFSMSKLDSDFEQKVNDVRDWLSSFSDQDKSIQDKVIKHNTFQQAITHTEKWHLQLEKAMSKQKTISITREGLETLLEYEDGSGWFKLLTPESKDYEGSHMGHCVGSGGYDNRTIYSFRDHENKPHCTIEFDENSRDVQQVKGKGNRAVVEKYIQKVIEFIDVLKPKNVRDATNFGCFFYNRLYNGRKMPDSFVHNHGDLNFSSFGVPIHNLPDKIICTNSNLIIDFKDKNIEAKNFPQEIYIVGNLTVKNAKGLKVGSLVCNYVTFENCELDFTDAAVLTSESTISGCQVLNKAIIKDSKLKNFKIIPYGDENELDSQNKIEYKK